MKGVGLTSGCQVTCPKTAVESSGNLLCQSRCSAARVGPGMMSSSVKRISSLLASLMPTFRAAAGPLFSCRKYRMGMTGFVDSSRTLVAVASLEPSSTMMISARACKAVCCKYAEIALCSVAQRLCVGITTLSEFIRSTQSVLSRTSLPPAANLTDAGCLHSDTMAIKIAYKS